MFPAVGDGRERSKSFARKSDATAYVAQVSADMTTGTYVDTTRCHLPQLGELAQFPVGVRWTSRATPTYC
jgi:hypothetical protein